jgi:hypothetical protein
VEEFSKGCRSEFWWNNENICWKYNIRHTFVTLTNFYVQCMTLSLFFMNILRVWLRIVCCYKVMDMLEYSIHQNLFTDETKFDIINFKLTSYNVFFFFFFFEHSFHFFFHRSEINKLNVWCGEQSQLSENILSFLNHLEFFMVFHHRNWNESFSNSLDVRKANVPESERLSCQFVMRKLKKI